MPGNTHFQTFRTPMTGTPANDSDLGAFSIFLIRYGAGRESIAGGRSQIAPPPAFRSVLGSRLAYRFESIELSKVVMEVPIAL
jgi:hypothetical protein